MDDKYGHKAWFRSALLPAALLISGCQQQYSDAGASGSSSTAVATVTTEDCKAFETDYSTLACTAKAIDRFSAQSSVGYTFEYDDARPAVYQDLERLKDRPEMRQCRKIQSQRRVFVESGSNLAIGTFSNMPDAAAIQAVCRQRVRRDVRNFCSMDGSCDPNPDTRTPGQSAASSANSREVGVILRRCIDDPARRACVEKSLVVASPADRAEIMKAMLPMMLEDPVEVVDPETPEDRAEAERLGITSMDSGGDVSADHSYSESDE